MKVRYLVALVSALCASASWAREPFEVKDIRVEGIQRTEAGTVFSYLPVKVGDVLDDEKAAAAIKALYATGFFKDVRLESENGVLIVVIEERPAIAQITIVGAKEFEKDKLKEGLKQAGLAESRIFDRSTLEKAEQELKQQYMARGKYAVKITTTTTPLERNRVGITFHVDEGRTAKIRKINIVGNKAFKEKDLLSAFSLRTPGLLTWLTKEDQYSKQKLGGDLESLRSYYLNRGYLEFSIESTQVSITPDMQDIYITVNIVEGPKYDVSEIKLAGELLVPEEELRKLIQLSPGDTFSREKLTESIKLITDRLGDDGYAFANVNASPQLDKEKQQVAFTFFIDPGRRVYVRRINITGNSRTRDEVIRREMRQFEGGWYSTSKINRSKTRVDRLNYFTAVNVETPAVPGTTDQIDVNVEVKEKPTGAVMFGAGYSNMEGLILSGSVAQDNIFGTGKFVNLMVNTGSVNKTYSLSYTDPYFTKDGVTAGLDLYKRVLNTRTLSSVMNFNTDTLGAGLRFGIPINENDSIMGGLGAEQTTIDLGPDSPQRNIDFVNKFGRTTINIPATLSWRRDGRDSAIWTTSGTTQRVFAEVGLPGGDLTYYKLSYDLRWYFPITEIFTLMLNGELGYGDGYSGKELPFFKNFFAGGNTSVRGYNISSLGPRDATNRTLGGNKRAVGNIEVLFPMPGMRNDRTVRLSAFLDGGTVWGPGGVRPDQEGLRYSAGIAVTWISPMGPLKISVAQPLNSQPGDNIQRFQFQFGQQF
ncbi:outer membrane protein assembly factor BamA [Nitrosospira multiformis]|uniref:Outer membrane protein assembly factor BamA n=1 Tax=Nitrosospira multiformis (strain ATCC 25196 / NCIMB 11849 / C 71) TaxID=323848 RepID=Q2YB99_NITMU|nr:outer membrane protein assembly factor BamA [Nitrosospira multiformis]ABB73972.1 surface antigen (D15) [Nitrosospira multiformis ATCC 25196]SEA31563.1 Beta-barrel assembly machine subunit BamA [Nitrosospira multiformis]SEF53562.1 Beta-barrel assembly machine subunit BamA [Nitrosospira multiformis ATCC 25196]